MAHAGRAPSSGLHLKPTENDPSAGSGRGRPATKKESQAEAEGFQTGRIYWDLPAHMIASPYHEKDPLYQWWLFGLAKAKRLGRPK